MTARGYSDRGKKSSVIDTDSILGRDGVFGNMKSHRAAAGLDRSVLTAGQRRLDHHHRLPAVFMKLIEARPHFIRTNHCLVQRPAQLPQKFL